MHSQDKKQKPRYENHLLKYLGTYLFSLTSRMPARATKHSLSACADVTCLISKLKQHSSSS